MKRPVRILLVEDEAFIAMSLEIDLQDAGYHVLKWVAAGEDAVTTAQRENPDVILMDIRLAGKIDGIEAAIQIQETMDIPVIFMTGYQDKEIKKRLTGIKTLGHLAKPVIVQDIKAIIDAEFKF